MKEALPQVLCWTEGRDVKYLCLIAGSLERCVQWLDRYLTDQLESCPLAPGSCKLVYLTALGKGWSEKVGDTGKPEKYSEYMCFILKAGSTSS